MGGVIEGSMNAWPSAVETGRRDRPSLWAVCQIFDGASSEGGKRVTTTR